MSKTSKTSDTTLNSADNETDEQADTDADWLQCANCGAAVTREYHRVLSDNQDVLRACLHCSTQGANYGGERR